MIWFGIFNFILGLILGSDGVFLILVGIVLFSIGLKKAMDNEDNFTVIEKCAFLEKYYNHCSCICDKSDSDKLIEARNTFRVLKRSEVNEQTETVFSSVELIYQDVREKLDVLYKKIYKKYNDLQDGKLNINYDNLKTAIKNSKYKIYELNNIDHLLDYLLLLSNDTDNREQGYTNIVDNNNLFRKKPRKIDYCALECFISYGLLNNKIPFQASLLYNLLECESYSSLIKQLNDIYNNSLKKLNIKEFNLKDKNILNIINYMQNELNDMDIILSMEEFLECFNNCESFSYEDSSFSKLFSKFNYKISNFNCSLKDYLNYMYDNALTDTDDLFFIIRKSRLFYDIKMDRDSFAEITILFHLILYRELLSHKYSFDIVYKFIMTQVVEVSKHSTKFDEDKREKFFCDLFIEILETFTKCNDVENPNEFSFDTLASVYMAYIFSFKNIDVLNHCESDMFPEFENLFSEIMNHFIIKYESCDFINYDIIV